MKTWNLVALLAAIATVASAQNGIETLPNNYKLVLENEWVRVVRVHYGPHEKLPIHDHTVAPAAYVYLADGGPVRFRHMEPYQSVNTRPPVKLGGFRMYPAVVERHEVENASDVPSDFLRVEFKTLSEASPSPHGRFPPPDLAAGQNLEKVEFEDKNLRIVRSVCAAHQACNSSEVLSGGLEITLTPTMLVQKGAKVDCVQLQAGQVRWVTSTVNGETWNPGETAAHRLRFEFKGVH